MRDKQWLSELGYHRRPRRGFTGTAILDLLGFAALCCFGIAVAYMLGAI
jgi:hypothetical protein